MYELSGYQENPKQRDERWIQMSTIALSTAIMTAGVLVNFLFGRVDTMAGLFLMAILVIWESGNQK
jgi:hypothetical protein